jgi:hypothetical protein
VVDFLFTDEKEVVRRIGNDVFRSWDIIAFGSLLSVIIGLLFLIFFRFPGSMPVCIAVSCMLTIILLGAMAYFLYQESDRVYDLVNDDYYDVEMEKVDKDVHSKAY